MLCHKKTGKRTKKRLSVQRYEDPGSVATRFCQIHAISVDQCKTVESLLVKRKMAALNTAVPPPTLHIIVQYYNDQFAPRREELDACVRFNLANPHVIQVHHLLEPETNAPLWLTSHPKSGPIHRIPGRLTFQAAFEYANTRLPNNSSVVVMNLDTYLDHSSPWDTFTGQLHSLTGGAFSSRIALTLSRLETDLTGQVWRNADLEASAYAIAQDAWVLKTPLHVKDADFSVGNCPGSDNAIADRLYQAGVNPINLAHDFRVYHLDIARKKADPAELPKMVVTMKTDLSRPHLRGHRIVPVFGDISTFHDLQNFKQLWGEVDPMMEYMYVLEYLGMKGRIQQKFVHGGIIEDSADIKDVQSLRREWEDQVESGIARPNSPASTEAPPALKGASTRPSELKRPGFKQTWDT